MSYSVDLRERVLAALDRGMPRAEVISTFAVSSGSLKRWRARQRAGLDIAPISPPGPSPTISPDLHDQLRAQLTAHSDATLTQHAELWNAAHATSLSPRTLGRAIRVIGWTRKKSRWLPRNATHANETSSEPVS